MAKKPDIDEAEDIDTGPLTREQLQSLARDQIAAVRSTAQELRRNYDVTCDMMLIRRLETQLCGK
jgi:hypothetical protein